MPPILCLRGEMIKAITFDFWQTLYADSLELKEQRQELRANRCRKFLSERGHICTPDEVNLALQNAYKFVFDLWYEHRGVPVENCMLRFMETLQLELDDVDVHRLVSVVANAFLDTAPALVPHAKQVLARLHGEYQLALISDTALTPGCFVRQLLERDGILKNFSILTFSDETTHTKPEVEQFHSTLRSLGVEPSTAIHIGDIVRTDIVGAKNAGMRAIRFSGVNKNEQEDTLSDAVIDDFRELESTIAQLCA